MINEILTGLLLLAPVILMLIPSIKYWQETVKARKAEKSGESGDKGGKVAAYKQPFWTMLGIGYFCMWIVWIGGIVLLLFTDYAEFSFGWTFHPSAPVLIQIIGLIFFYSGAMTYFLHLVFAGKYIQPSNSGTFAEHKLVDRGPFAVVRHPLYVSYVLISGGLCLTLMSFWYLIPTALVLAGIYPTAKAEEDALLEQLGDKYAEYRKRVGMFIPKFSRRPV